MRRREFLLQNVVLASAAQAQSAAWNAGSVVHAAGRFASFDATALDPATAYDLQLLDGTAELCGRWKLKTFPAPGDRTHRSFTDRTLLTASVNLCRRTFEA